MIGVGQQFHLADSVWHTPATFLIACLQLLYDLDY